MISELKVIIGFYNFGKGKDLYKKFVAEIEELYRREDLSESQIINILSNYLIQFIFKYGLTIIKYTQIGKKGTKKKKYKNNIRHNFPSRFDEPTQKKIVTILKMFIEHSGKNINIRYKESNSYFNVSDFTSIINIIFCWKDSLFELGSKTKKDIKLMFQKSNVLVYLKNEYLNRLFGVNGLLAREHLSSDKFIATLNTSKYTRSHISHYKEKGYLPVGFLALVCNQYSEFSDYFQYIKHVQLGKSTKEEGTKLISFHTLKQILREFDFFKEFIVTRSSNFGWIFTHNQAPREEEDISMAFQRKYEANLQKRYTKKTVDKYQHHVDKIKSKLQVPREPVVIISLELANFRSYQHEKILFQNGFNILYGLNGSGKSTVIEAILFGFLQLHPRFSLSYIPDNTYTFNPLYIFLSNTWLIRRGAPSCEVTLVLKVGDKPIKISRRMEKNGFQEIKVEDRSIFEGLEEFSATEGVSDIFLKSEDFFKNSLEEQVKFKQKHNNFAMKVFDKFRERGILFERDEIFTSYFTEFQYFWKWENQGRDDDISDFYRDKLGLGYLDSLIINKEMSRKEEVEKKSKLSERLSLNLSDPILFNRINRNKWFNLQTGDCYMIDHYAEQLVEEARRTGVEISLETSQLSHSDAGVYCQKCGAFYCWECIGNRGQEGCFECKHEDGWSLTLPTEDTQRREYHSIYFDVFFERIPLPNYPSLKTENKKGGKVIQGAVRRLKLSRLVLETFFTAIFEILKGVISVSEASEQKNLELKEIKRIINSSQSFRNLDILSYYSTLMLYILYKMTGEYNEPILDDIDNLLSESKIRVHKELEEYQSVRRQHSKRIWDSDTFRHDTYEFENRMFHLLYYIYVISDSKIFHQGFRNSLHDSKYHDEILGYREILKEFVYTDLEIVETPLKSYSETKIFYKDYQIEQVHELDHRILLEQLKNQIMMLSIRDKALKEIEQIDGQIKQIDKELLFLRQNYEFVYNNIYLQYLDTEIKRKSPQIFNKDDFYAFIDEAGFPRLQYNDSEESAPIVILSNGEKSKLFLAILGTLLSLSNRNQFLLIDEPNEFLDPENIDLMKEYFSSIFRNKQLILCTFIKDYKEFQPAMIFEVKKGLQGKSEVTRLKF